MQEESDLSEAGAEGVYTEPGGTVDVVDGQRFCALDKAESFEWKAGILLLSIGSYYSLAIQVTPWKRGDGVFLFFYKVLSTICKTINSDKKTHDFTTKTLVFPCNKLDMSLDGRSTYYTL